MTIGCLALINIDFMLLLGGGRVPSPSTLPSVVGLLVMAGTLAIASMLSNGGERPAGDRPGPAAGKVLRRFGAPRDRRA